MLVSSLSLLNAVVLLKICQSKRYGETKSKIVNEAMTLRQHLDAFHRVCYILDLVSCFIEMLYRKIITSGQEKTISSLSSPRMWRNRRKKQRNKNKWCWTSTCRKLLQLNVPSGTRMVSFVRLLLSGLFQQTRWVVPFTVSLEQSINLFSQSLLQRNRHSNEWSTLQRVLQME